MSAQARFNPSEQFTRRDLFKRSAGTLGLLLFPVPPGLAAGRGLQIAELSGAVRVQKQPEFTRISLEGGPASCTLIGQGFRLRDYPVLDCWLRISSSRACALLIDYGTDPVYGFHGQLVYVDIASTQSPRPLLGHLGDLPVGEWRHIRFDLGFAFQTHLDLEDAYINRIRLGDWARGYQFADHAAGDIFSVPSDTLFTAAEPDRVHSPNPIQHIDLRNFTVRSRLPADGPFVNDTELSLAAHALVSDAPGKLHYLFAGYTQVRGGVRAAQLKLTGEGVSFQKIMGGLREYKGLLFFSSLSPSQGQAIASLLDGQRPLAQARLTLSQHPSYLGTGTVHIIPSSHNDIAWWDTPQRTADLRKEKIIGPAIEYMQQDPAYRFSMECVLYLMEYLERVPSHKSLVEKLTVDGRLHWGATYNQTYESLLSGEALVRELYYGKKWLKENLGEQSRSIAAWNSDVPARALQMPQILRKSGVRYLFIDRFQPGLWEWRSPDGSGVIACSLGQYGRLQAYLEPARPAAVAQKLPGLLEKWNGYFQQHRIAAEFPLTQMSDYSSPRRDLLDLVRDWQAEVTEKLKVPLRLRFSTGAEYLDAVTARSEPQLPVITGERPNVWLYIHGPTHHKAIQAGREAAWYLTTAEKFWTWRCLLSPATEQYPRREFDDAWMAAIYPDHGWGGHEGEKTDQVFAEKLETARQTGLRLCQEAMDWLAQRTRRDQPQGQKLVVFNPLPWDRQGVVEIHVPHRAGHSLEVLDKDGRPMTIQSRPNGSGQQKILFVSHMVPALGYSSYALRSSASEPAQPPDENFSEVYENKFYRIRFAPAGLKSIFDKQLGKELLHSEEFLAGEVFRLRSVGNGAGEFGTVQQPDWKELEKLSQYEPFWEIMEAGEVRRAWRLRQKMEYCTAELRLYLYQELKRIDFELDLLNWTGEPYKEFRMAFPLDIPHGSVVYEVPYGALEVGKDELKGIALKGWYERPCPEEHPREVQNWITVSSGHHSVSMSSSVAVVDYLDSNERNDRYTLLQPVLLASRKSCHQLGNWYLQAGHHSFHFSLTSFEGDWRNNYRFGNEINCPLIGVTPAENAGQKSFPSEQSFCRSSAPNFVISTAKLADDGRGFILRGYEIEGKSASVQLTFALSLRSGQPTNLIEEDQPGEIGVQGHTASVEVGPRAIEAFRFLSGAPDE